MTHRGRLGDALVLALVVAAAGGNGCARPSIGAPQGASPLPQAPLFADVAERAGIRFVHSNGANGQFRYIEWTPAGCALFDYDNDGYLDILLLQSGPSDPPARVRDRPHCALYHNNGDGTFADVTQGSGFDRDLGYAQGVAIGDYDNDGYDDVFITAYGGNHLLRNESTKQTGGAGARRHFRDVTHEVGLDKIHSTGFATSAAFGDYDNDGRLDLFVCYYAPWTYANDVPCADSSGHRFYCTPDTYPPDTCVLYHNDGGRFTDVSARAGIAGGRARGLAVAFLDYDVNGRQDIYVANDLEPANLWRNNGSGTFTDTAVDAGCGYAAGGNVMSGMGIGLSDYDHSGRDSIFVTNFSGRPNTLFRSSAGGLFTNVSDEADLAAPHEPFLAFGCEFIDYDADGWPDLVVANGHVQVDPASLPPGVDYRERKQLFHNTGAGRFTEITDPGALGDLALPTASRGLATGDFDNNGRPDILVSNQNGAAQLFRNMDRSGHHWVEFKPVGVSSNRDGLHARFAIRAGAITQTSTVRAGTSYLSHSDTRVFFGLGSARSIDSLEVHWPGGVVDHATALKPDRIYVVREGSGIVGTLPGPH